MSTTKLKVVLSHLYTAAGPKFWQLSEVPETRCLTKSCIGKSIRKTYKRGLQKAQLLQRNRTTLRII